jgi:hypothetical protein
LANWIWPITPWPPLGFAALILLILVGVMYEVHWRNRGGLPGPAAPSTLERKLVASGQVAPASVGAWGGRVVGDDSGGDADSAGK